MTQEQIVQFIFIILPFVLTGVGIPLVTWGITKLPASKQELATKYVQLAVNAVEQLAIKNTSGLTGTAKKALAEQFATTMLKNVGLSVDTQVINTLIENAVFLLNQPQSVISSPSVLNTVGAPAITTTPVSSFTYATDQVSSTTSEIPVVTASTATMAAVDTANTGGPTSPLAVAGQA